MLMAALARMEIDVNPTPAQAQLLPGDPLFAELSDPSDTPAIEFHTVGDTSVTLTRIYSWHWAPGSLIPRWDFPNPVPLFDWTKVAVEVPGISPMLDQIPDAAVFPEQRDGEGDICVALPNARLAGVPHRSLPINHGQALFDDDLFAHVGNLLGTPIRNIDVPTCNRGFIGNLRTRELHDLAHETRQCQVDEIIHRWPFDTFEAAFAKGCDGCAYCMPEHHHR
jgi:hypothetical protein